MTPPDWIGAGSSFITHLQKGRPVLSGAPAQNQAVVQLHFGLQVSQEQKALQVYGQVRSVPGQVGRKQQLHAILVYHTILGSVPSTDVGIDRYLDAGAGSRGEGKQVDSGLAASFLDVFDGSVAQG